MAIGLHIVDENFHDGQRDSPYLQRFAKYVVQNKVKCHVTNRKFDLSFELVLWAREKGITQVATTSVAMLRQLITDTRHRPTLDDYAGSIVHYQGIEFLILNPLEHLFTVSYAPFLFKRYLDKFIVPAKFIQLPPFEHHIFEPAMTEIVVTAAGNADFIAIDIETIPAQRVITCCGFTCVKFHDNPARMSVYTFVIPFDDPYNIAVARVICDLPVEKVFQNGKYDNLHLIRYNIPVRSWSGDTQHLFHSFYSELPKRLDFITAFFLRDWSYWKAESATSDLREYYRYNAKDSFTTAMVWIGLLTETPDWAWVNYHKEFPLVFPCLLTEGTGIAADKEYMDSEYARFEASLEAQLINIRTMVGNDLYNPSSSQQTLKLLHILGSTDAVNADAKALDKVAFRHPLNQRILGAIKKYREDRKIATTYLREEDPKTHEHKLWHSRFFYSLNPHFTDTGRLSSRESAFDCGTNIQNQPRDRDDIEVKGCFVSDPEFFMGEADYSQNETWNTAYQSGDANLIRTIEDRSKDFHGLNASMFFGVPYERIVQSTFDANTGEWNHKKLDKILRDAIGKRINHGANYNMMAAMLLVTMGYRRVAEAKAYLKLPSAWSLIRVCEYLLEKFDQTYPGIRRHGWFPHIINTVKNTSMLIGPTGWTRFCFGHPGDNKRDTNRYVAHHPQSLAAMRLNEAYISVYKHVALPNPRTFKLGPQIHDSILFQYRKGYGKHIFAVRDCMDITTPVKDIYGTVRQLRVPIDLKGEANRWSELKDIKRLSDLC